MKYSLELGTLFTPMNDVSHFNVYCDFIRNKESCEFWMKRLDLNDSDKYVKVTLLHKLSRSIFSFRIVGKDSVYYGDIWEDRCLTMIPCGVNVFELVGYISRCYGIPYDEVLHNVNTNGFYIPDGLEVKIV